MMRDFPASGQAAQEAGRSRIYGGIHYECDNREGLAVGRAIAAYVAENPAVPALLPERRTADRCTGRELQPAMPETESLNARPPIQESDPVADAARSRSSCTDRTSTCSTRAATSACTTSSARTLRPWTA